MFGPYFVMQYFMFFFSIFAIILMRKSERKLYVSAFIESEV